MRFSVLPTSAARQSKWESSVVDLLTTAGCCHADVGSEASEAQDFVLDFTNSASAHSRARYGTWSFEIDAAGPWAWGAVAEGRRSVRARLVAEASAERIVLLEGALPVSPSCAITRTYLQRALAPWPARAVALIRSGAWNQLPRIPIASRPCFPPPSGLRALWRLSLPWRLLVQAWRDLTSYDIWNVGVVMLDRPLRDVVELAALPPTRWLPARAPLRSLADPFPYRYEGRGYLLVEEFGPARGAYGRIAQVDPDGASEPTLVAPVVDRGRHVSYPCTFAGDDGQVYCVLEASTEGDGCPIYRLEANGVWRLWRRILSGRQVNDPTIIDFDSRWWLFCTNGDVRGRLTLEAFHADRLDGEWTPHALNPLKTDLATARPAGRPFSIGGRFFRPAQDCSDTYGGAVAVMEILELTPERFREIPVTRLEPDRDGPYPDGLHHLVIDDDRLYVDGKKERRTYWPWWKLWRAHQPAE